MIAPMPATIHLAAASDLARINEIYNDFVLHSTCTYQEQPSTAVERTAWFERHGPRHPVIVARHGNEVVGWGSLSPYHARSAYRFTVENSVYVDRRWHRQGLGHQILTDLVARARALGHHTIIAGIDSSQDASVALHTRHGFVKVAHLAEVGYKFDRWLDVVYMQLML